MNYVEIGEALEQQTIRFLKKIGFQDVDGGSKFQIAERQIDACGGHEDTLLIVECTTQADINKKIDEFRGKISGLINGFKSNPKYNKYKRFKLILAVGTTDITQANIDRAHSMTPEVYLWGEKYINYYNGLVSSIDKKAIYGLLADIGVKPVNKETIVIPAFAANVGGKKYKLFLFFVEAQDLLRIAYVARRETGNSNFYQRMVQKSRLKAIARYVEKGKIFPNSIIVALDKGSWKFKDLTTELNKQRPSC